MFSWLRKKHQHDPDDLVEEHWETNFSRFAKRRFPSREEGDGYIAVRGTGFLELSLTRRNLFAWLTDPVHQYRDLMLEADIRFDDSNGYSAAGVLFRYIEDGGYYYLLVSNQGHFRFDLVFNDSPRTLIPWTPAPLPEGGHIVLRVIAHDTSFVFTVNDQWVGEYTDDSLEGGRIAFAAQNYGDAPGARFFLERLRIDSLPIDVEAGYYRWTRALTPPRQARIALAESLYAGAQYSPAAVQLKKAFARKSPSASEYFSFAECCIQLGLFAEAREAIEHTLELDPGFADAIKEKANLLYMQNSFLELRDYLKPLMERFDEDAVAWNLLGHGEFGLGNWTRAAEAYRRAASLDSEMPIFAMNAAHAWERAGNSDESLKEYLTAARLYFRQESYYDLEGLLPAIRELSADNQEARALEGKVLFGRGEYGEADRLFRELLKSGYEQSEVLFLHGLVLASEGRRDVAADFLLQAAQKEPDYYLYWLKLADNLHAMGLDAMDETERALELAPENPWVLNLAGLLYAEKNRLDEARALLERAIARAPEEEEIQANMAFLVNLEQGVEAGLAYLDELEVTLPDSHALLNQRANLLVAAKQHDEAVRYYERALRLDPGNRDYRMNCAAACLEVDMISRAEELYQDLLDSGNDPDAMTGIGNCAWMKSEFLRAETAYREALNLNPACADAHCNLAELLLTRRRFEEAEAVLKAAAAELDPVPARLERLTLRLHELAYDIYRCASCGLEWRELKSGDPVPPARIHGEPPGDAPAGKCENCGRVYCVACASARLEGSRLACECGGALKLNETPLRRILLRKIRHP